MDEKFTGDGTVDENENLTGVEENADGAQNADIQESGDVSESAETAETADYASEAEERAAGLHNDGLTGKVMPIDVEYEMKRAFIEYSMSVIVDRALPDVRFSSRDSRLTARTENAPRRSVTLWVSITPTATPPFTTRS